MGSEQKREINRYKRLFITEAARVTSAAKIMRQIIKGERSLVALRHDAEKWLAELKQAGESND